MIDGCKITSLELGFETFTCTLVELIDWPLTIGNERFSWSGDSTMPDEHDSDHVNVG